MGLSQSKMSYSGSGSRHRRTGFQHNNAYKVVSMKDKNVMEVADVSVDGEIPVVVKKPSSKKQSQKFKALESEINPGEFSISVLAQDAHGDLKVWDFMPADALLINNFASGGRNQVWVAEEIRPNTKICIIRSANDGRCLKNLGLGKQVALVTANEQDPAQHWMLQPTF